MDSLVKYPALSHLAPRLKNNVINKFTMAEEIFEALHAAYGDTDKKHMSGFLPDIDPSAKKGLPIWVSVMPATKD